MIPTTLPTTTGVAGVPTPAPSTQTQPLIQHRPQHQGLQPPPLGALTPLLAPTSGGFDFRSGASRVQADIPSRHSGEAALQPLLDHLLVTGPYVPDPQQPTPQAVPNQPGWRQVSYCAWPPNTDGAGTLNGPMPQLRVTVQVDANDTVRTCTWQAIDGTGPLQAVTYEPGSHIGHAGTVPAPVSAVTLPGLHFQPSVLSLGPLSGYPMAPGQDHGWIRQITGLPAPLAQRLIEALAGTGTEPSPTLYRVHTTSGNEYLRIELRDRTDTQQCVWAHFRLQDGRLHVTQAQYRPNRQASWAVLRNPRPPTAPTAPTAGSDAISGLSSVGSLQLGGLDLQSDAGSTRTRRLSEGQADDSQSRRNVRPRYEDLSAARTPVAHTPVTLDLTVASLYPLHHEVDPYRGNDAEHAINHALQGAVQRPGSLPASTDSNAALSALGRHMVQLAGGEWQRHNIGAMQDTDGTLRVQTLQQATHSGVLIAQTQPDRYVVIVRQSARSRPNDPNWQPWQVLATDNPTRPGYANLNAALTALEQQGAGRHSQGLNVLYPKQPLATLQNGHGVYLPDEGFVPTEYLSPQEQQHYQVLHLSSPGQAQPPTALGAQPVPNLLGVHLQGQLPGQGGYPACVINHLLQDNMMPTGALPTATLNQTAGALTQYTGALMTYYGVPSGDQRAHTALAGRLAVTGAGMFEIGDLGTVGGRTHHVALLHLATRQSNTPGGQWLVLDSGVPSAGEPASVRAFGGPNGLAQALDHLVARSPRAGGMLSAFVPQQTLPPLHNGSGVYLPTEGYVPTQHLLPAELPLLQRQYPGLQLQPRPTLVPLPPPTPQLSASQGQTPTSAPQTQTSSTTAADQTSSTTSATTSATTTSGTAASASGSTQDSGALREPRNLNRLSADGRALVRAFVRKCNNERGTAPKGSLQNHVNHLFETFEWLQGVRQLDAAWIGAERLPDRYLQRAVVMLSGQPTTETDPAALRARLQPFTQPNALQNGISPGLFLALPRPLQQSLVDQAIQQRDNYREAQRTGQWVAQMPHGVSREARAALNHALGLGLQGGIKRFDSFVPLLEQNRHLLQAAARPEEGLKQQVASTLLRWIDHAETMWEPGKDNPVRAVLDGTQPNEANARRQFEANEAVSGFLQSLGASACTYLWTAVQWCSTHLRSPQTANRPPTPTLSMDAVLLETYAGTDAARLQQRGALIAVMDRLAASALDGDYSPTRLALHTHRDVQPFLTAVGGLLPGVTLDAATTAALTDLHAWFRQYYYG